jgi:hypothetical protein
VMHVGTVIIDKGNPFLTVKDCFISDLEGVRLFGYLGTDSRVCIGKGVELIGKECFLSCENLKVKFSLS